MKRSVWIGITLVTCLLACFTRSVHADGTWGVVLQGNLYDYDADQVTETSAVGLVTVTSTGDHTVSIYTYDPATHLVTVNTILDENGCVGLADNGAPYAMKAMVGPDAITFCEGDQCDWTFERVQSVMLSINRI